jgi:ADP-ribosylglycohydrolase
MAALAAGDAIGDIARDRNSCLPQAESYRFRYGIITEMYDGAQSTDDTEFAVLTARSVLDSRGILTHDSVAQAWRRYILDRGGMQARGGRPLYGAVENLKRGIVPPQSGRDNVFNTDDGAAMRITPVGIAYAGHPERAAELAAIEASISHAESGIWAAQAVAAAVAVAMADGTPEEICSTMLRTIPEDSWLGRSMARARDLCDGANEMLDIWSLLHTEFATREHAAVEEALPEIYGVARMTEVSFRQGMFWAANFGRDADTIAAIVGALAGAREGIGAIPESWLEPVRRPTGTCLPFAADEDVVDLGTKLAELAMELGCT